MLTHKELLEYLDYDANTGIFIRKVATKPNLIGKPAGHKNKAGYVVIKLKKYVYKAHRLAFFYMTGKWPSFEVDHVDGNKSNNSWNNLRDVSHSTNMRNITKVYRTNKVGVTGVTKQGNKFKAQKIISGVKTHLGMYDTIEEASIAYQAAKYD